MGMGHLKLVYTKYGMKHAALLILVPDMGMGHAVLVPDMGMRHAVLVPDMGMGHAILLILMGMALLIYWYQIWEWDMLY